MPRTGFRGKARPPLAHLHVDHNEEAFKLTLKCPHGEWMARFTPDDIGDGSDEHETIKMITRLATELVTIHDNGGHPTRCVKKIRPLSMGTPTNIEPVKMFNDPILIVMLPKGQLILDFDPSAARYRIRMNCDHNFCELLVSAQEVEQYRDGNLGVQRHLWAKMIQATDLHHQESGCHCLLLPSFDAFVRLREITAENFPVPPFSRN